MEKEGVYYRMAGHITHAGCECLPAPHFEIGRIIISHIDFKDSIQVNGQRKENVFEAYFAPNPYTNLPFLLNSTNAKRIAKMFWDTKVEDGTPCEGRINLLKDIPVRLCRELTRDPSDGGQVYGLRISKLPASPESAPKPKALPVLTADKVEAAKNWMAQNGKTIDDVKKQYLVPADLEAKLKESDEDLPD